MKNVNCPKCGKEAEKDKWVLATSHPSTVEELWKCYNCYIKFFVKVK